MRLSAGASTRARWRRPDRRRNIRARSAVQHLSRRRVKTERDVGESEDRTHARELGLDPSDRFDRLDAVAPRFDHPRRERQRQGVDEYVLGVESVARDGEIGDGTCRAHLPFGRARCPSSSMQVATMAAPNSAASDKNPSRRVPGPSPSSRLTELSSALPPSHVSAWRATLVSVVSTMMGPILRCQSTHQFVHVRHPSAPV